MHFPRRPGASRAKRKNATKRRCVAASGKGSGGRYASWDFESTSRDSICHSQERESARAAPSSTANCHCQVVRDHTYPLRLYRAQTPLRTNTLAALLLRFFPLALSLNLLKHTRLITSPAILPVEYTRFFPSSPFVLFTV